MRKCKLGIDSIETTLTWERGDRCLPNPWRDDRSILRLEDGISIFISVELRFSRNDAADKGNDDQVSRWVNIKKGRGQPVAPRRALPLVSALKSLHLHQEQDVRKILFANED